MAYPHIKVVTEQIVDGVVKVQDLYFETLEQAKKIGQDQHDKFNVPVTIYDFDGKVVETLAPVAK